MKKNDIWVVPIDFSPTDLEVIEYTRFLATFQKPEKVYFVNVVKEFKASFSQEFQGFQEQVIIDQKLKLENKVDMHFKTADVPYECRIMTGIPFQEIIGLVLNRAASLVILGKKRISSGSGIVSDRLSRNLPCSVLLVTEDFEPKLSNVLVTTDFSEHADLAMEEVQELLTEKEGVNLFAIHGYDVPSEFPNSGKTQEEYVEIIKANAEEEMLKWCQKFDHKISPILTHQGELSLAKQVVDQVDKLNIDLIVMGSKGQTVASLARLGSNTMKVLQANSQVPMLVVKKPGENMNFIESLREG